MPLYSYSRIGTYFTCPRQYKFRYIEKPPIEKITGVEAFMGTIAHKTLEECYRLVKVGKSPELNELLSLYDRFWDEELPEKLNIVRENMTADDYRVLGRNALTMYHKKHFPFTQEITLGLERRVDFSLDAEGRYRMQGFIDRLSQSGDGCLRIQDYKTSGTLPTQKDIDNEAQLALYQIAVEEMWPDNNGIELVWHFLQFDRTFVSHRTKAQLETLRQTYIEKIRQIESATESDNFPAKETKLCNWCEYRELCPAKGGPGSPRPKQGEIVLVSEDQIETLVDEYIELDGQKKELGKRLDEIKEQLIALSASETTKLLQGNRGSITVSTTHANKLPTKSSRPKDYAQVEQIIKDSGLYEDFSALELRRLQKAFDEHKLPDDMLGQLSGYAQPVNQHTVRIKRA